MLRDSLEETFAKRGIPYEEYSAMLEVLNEGMRVFYSTGRYDWRFGEPVDLPAPSTDLLAGLAAAKATEQ
jgi:hypothetical protein